MPESSLLPGTGHREAGFDAQTDTVKIGEEMGSESILNRRGNSAEAKHGEAMPLAGLVRYFVNFQTESGLQRMENVQSTIRNFSCVAYDEVKLGTMKCNEFRSGFSLRLPLPFLIRTTDHTHNPLVTTKRPLRRIGEIEKRRPFRLIW